EEAAGAGLRRREGLGARLQQLADHALDRVVVVAENTVLENREQLALARRQRRARAGFLAVGLQVDLDMAARREDRRDLALMAVVIRLQLLLDARLGHAGDLQHAAIA